MSIPGYQTFYPRDSVFTQKGMEAGFIGKSTVGLKNPGEPGADPNYDGILLGMFKEPDLTIYYSKNNHFKSVPINHIGINAHYDPVIVPWHPAVTKGSQVIVTQGDAIVVSYGELSDGVLSQLVVVSRVRDCGIGLIRNLKDGKGGAVHFSIDTLFGYHKDEETEKSKCDGGIMEKVLLQYCGEAKDIHIAIGPSISGIKKDGSFDFCYEFGRRGFDRLFSLATDRHPSLPVDTLWEPHPDSSKVYIAFGKLLFHLLLLIGIRPENIDMTCNFCAYHDDRFISARRYGQEKDYPHLSKARREEAREAIETKRGNLAYMRLFPRLLKVA